MARKIVQKEAFVEVTQTVLGTQKTETKKIKIRPFATDTANVGIKYGVTIPTGDYASLRVDVMISAPCYKEEMIEVYAQCEKLAERLMDKTTEKLFKAREKAQTESVAGGNRQ